MTYTQLSLLVFRQPHIYRTLISLSIRRQHSHSINAATRRTQAQECQTDTIPFLIIRRISAQKSIGSNDTPNIPEPNLPGCPNSTSVMAPEIHVEPTDYDWHSRIRTHSYQEESGVFKLPIMVHSDQDSESCDGNRYGDKSECEAVTAEVRAERDYHCEAKGTRPGWHRVELCLDGRVSVCLQDRGSEEGISVGGDDHTEIHESSDNDFVVFEYTPDIADSDLAFCGGTALVYLETSFDVRPFFG